MIVQIEGFERYYIDDEGNVYVKQKKGLKKMKLEHHTTGYLYIGLYDSNGKRHHKRVHRLVAEAFVYNDDIENKTIVMHLNDNKSDNRAENLKWGTISENTQAAVEHGLMKNDKGYEDSQSIPVIAIDLETGEEFRFGSCRECARILGVQLSTVCRQVKGETKTFPRGRYLYKKDDNI